MAVSTASFFVRFPEFSGDRAPLDLVQRALAEAERRVSAKIWGNLRADGIGYLAAHLISSSPWGQQARLAAQDGSTTYGAAYERLLRTVSHGFRVTA